MLSRRLQAVLRGDACERSYEVAGDGLCGALPRLRGRLGGSDNLDCVNFWRSSVSRCPPFAEKTVRGVATPTASQARQRSTDRGRFFVCVSVPYGTVFTAWYREPRNSSLMVSCQ
jgi:hypothetical protein